MILILDFGSQYTRLIARRIRSFGVYTEIHSCLETFEEYGHLNPNGIILSGGPDSVFDKTAPGCDDRIFSWGKPILGICYGYQYTVHQYGGKVVKGEKGEYGRTHIQNISTAPILNGVPSKHAVWMSHADLIERLPDGFQCIAQSGHSPNAVSFSDSLGFIGLQFHPEVGHTEYGEAILKNFTCDICHDPQDWDMGSFKDNKINAIKEEVGKNSVICALSGGVDSSVTAKLLHEAIPNNLFCFYVNNGLMRKNESEYVESVMKKEFGDHFFSIHAEKHFLEKLAGVTDPEKKRKIIGNEFIRIFEKEAAKIPNVKYLAQGTLYPDVIESVSFKGPSATIKSHHNVGGLPEHMNLKLVEPLRELFKDEVRVLGKLLGLPDKLINRHPFPGPGLAIRLPGDITEEKLNILRNADEILIEEINQHGLYDKIWQAFCVLLPIKAVGVMGDSRTYSYALSIRCVTSNDAMTADWYHFPQDILSLISSRIINEVDGINRVLYDVTSKPPGTIEWE